jgi:hypothetical protein
MTYPRTITTFSQEMRPGVYVHLLYKSQIGAATTVCIEVSTPFGDPMTATVDTLTKAWPQMGRVKRLAMNARLGGSLREPHQEPPIVRLVGEDSSDQLEFSLPASQPDDHLARVVVLDVLVSGVPCGSFSLDAAGVEGWANACHLLAQETDKPVKK